MDICNRFIPAAVAEMPLSAPLLLTSDGISADDRHREFAPPHLMVSWNWRLASSVLRLIFIIAMI